MTQNDRTSPDLAARSKVVLARRTPRINGRAGVTEVRSY